MATGLWDTVRGLGKGPSLTSGIQGLWGGASSLVTGASWLAPQYAGATFALDGDGSMSGIPGAAYLNGVYYNAFADVPGASVTGGAGFATAVDAAGNVVGPFAANTLPATSGGAEVWEARTNLATRSGNTSVGWTVTGGSQSTGQSDPLGGSGAGLFTADGSTGTHFIILDGVSFVSGTTYTLSIFAKAGTTDRLQLTGASTAFGTSQYANFLLSGTGSVSASAGLTSSAIVQLAGGWYRCSITLPASASATGAAMAMSWLVTGSETRIPNTAASGSFYLWGAQLEAGSFPTPYIPTTTAAATRTALSLSIPSVYPTSGWVLTHSIVTTSSVTRIGACIIGSETTRTPLSLTTPSNVLGAWNGTVNLTKVVPATAGGILKAASTWDGSGRSLTGNNQTPSTDSNVFPTPTTLFVGSYAGNQNFYNERIQRIVIGSGRLSDAQLQALTA